MKINSTKNDLHIVLLLFFTVVLIIALMHKDAVFRLMIWVKNIISPDFIPFLSVLILGSTLLYQIRVFRKQQVESKFFEMVKYYRENIQEMQFRNPFFYKDGERIVDEEFVTGRRVIKTIFEQYKVGFKIATDLSVKDEGKESYLANYYKKTCKLHYTKEWCYSVGEDEWIKGMIVNEIAYLTTFWGVPANTDIELSKFLDNLLEEDNKTNFIDFLKQMVAVYEYNKEKQSDYSGTLKNNKKKVFEGIVEGDKPKVDNGNTKFFGGHQYHLGHFFRHLYQTVRYIDEQPWWLYSADEKYEFVKTLRAQMSNYEQALFFINSLTKLGRKWEYDNKKGKKLITKYNLIKNLPEDFIPGIKPQHYYPEVKFEWMDINN